MKTTLLIPLLACGTTIAAETTPPAPPAHHAPAQASAGIPAELRATWVVDVEASIAVGKTSPKWTPSDEKRLKKMAAGMSMTFTETEFRQTQGTRTVNFPATFKSRDGDARLVEITTPNGKTAVVRLMLNGKNQLQFVSESSPELGLFLWVKKTA